MADDGGAKIRSNAPEREGGERACWTQVAPFDVADRVPHVFPTRRIDDRDAASGVMELDVGGVALQADADGAQDAPPVVFLHGVALH